MGKPVAKKARRPALKIGTHNFTLKARVLAAVAEHGALTHYAIRKEAGFTEHSGSVTRALHGLPEGSSSGPAHNGLLADGLLTQETVDLDGTEEVLFEITDKGREALDEYLDIYGPLPDKRKESDCINRRYTEDEE